MNGTPDAEIPPSERVNDIPRITSALRRAVREALRYHKLAGNPVAIWQDGRVVWIPAEDIPEPTDEEEEG